MFFIVWMILLYLAGLAFFLFAKNQPNNYPYRDMLTIAGAVLMLLGMLGLLIVGIVVVVDLIF